ncbi:MAG TPA: RluA family pseudouridine synthase [Candidatus Hydrogenedentes bacterium]|nr:RluA family pseudouridine synthase [Candidatus Hydrogenedentota bacterium]
MSDTHFEATVDEAHRHLRLDVYLAEVIEDASRSFIKKLIKDGHVAVNTHICTKPARTMNLGEEVQTTIPPEPDILPTPENIPLEILYEDADIVVVNKPSGLIVHPAPGHPSGTLVNAILHHCPDFQRPGEDLKRPGIVHRLDKYTSGVVVVAKSPRAYASLARQAREHAFDRRYLALVRGDYREDHGRIDATIGRSLSDRKRMAVTGIHGREAITHFTVLERFGIASLIALQLETGRTHQIRVHCRFAGHPVLGDPVYGITDYASWKLPPEVRASLERLEGQALHAERLGIEHPATGERISLETPAPADFQAALEALRTLG